MNVYKHISEFIFDYCINLFSKNGKTFSNTKTKGQMWFMAFSNPVQFRTLTDCADYFWQSRRRDIIKIIEPVRNYCPYNIALLLDCQATSWSVEGIFSMLGKLVQKDRNFKPENSKYCIIESYKKLE